MAGAYSADEEGVFPSWGRWNGVHWATEGGGIGSSHILTSLPTQLALHQAASYIDGRDLTSPIGQGGVLLQIKGKISPYSERPPAAS